MIERVDHAKYAPTARTATPLVALVVVSGILLSGGLVDLPRYISLGPVTAGALLTIAYAFSIWILWVMRPIFVRRAILALSPFVALLIWSCTTFLWHAPSVPGVQNVLVLSAFVGFALLVSYESYRSAQFAELVWTTIVRAVWLAATLYVVSLLSSGLGFGAFLSSRAFALVALLGVACYLGIWRHRRPRGLWQASFLTLLIGVSLSRTALFVALMLFPLSQLSLKYPRRLVRVVLMTGFIAILTYLAITFIPPLNERFFAGDRAYEVGQVTVNTSGRTWMWSTIWDSYLSSPLTGLGAGSAEEVLFQANPEAAQHPHNDYLRLLHDYGLLGLVLWCLGFFCLLWVIGRSWVMASRRADPEASLHLAALLSLTGVAFAMSTDNTMIYLGVMVPFGALIGASLGRVGHRLQKPP
jgi:O-antigen ligase